MAEPQNLGFANDIDFLRNQKDADKGAKSEEQPKPAAPTEQAPAGVVQGK